MDRDVGVRPMVNDEASFGSSRTNSRVRIDSIVMLAFLLNVARKFPSERDWFNRDTNSLPEILLLKVISYCTAVIDCNSILLFDILVLPLSFSLTLIFSLTTFFSSFLSRAASSLSSVTYSTFKFEMLHVVVSRLLEIVSSNSSLKVSPSMSSDVTP